VGPTETRVFSKGEVTHKTLWQREMTGGSHGTKALAYQLAIDSLAREGSVLKPRMQSAAFLGVFLVAKLPSKRLGEGTGATRPRRRRRDFPSKGNTGSFPLPRGGPPAAVKSCRPCRPRTKGLQPVLHYQNKNWPSDREKTWCTYFKGLAALVACRNSGEKAGLSLSSRTLNNRGLPIMTLVRRKP